jgi:hypothetical protein
MPVITEEQLMQNLDFDCARCQTKCVKVNAVEPEVCYISKVNSELVGPLCNDCAEQIPNDQKRIRKVPETAFLIVLGQDGEGAYMTTQGIPLVYLREPTYKDIINCCQQVSKDVGDSVFAKKLTDHLLQVISAAQNQKIVVPRR